MIFAMSVGEFFPLGQGFRGRRAPATCQVWRRQGLKRASSAAGTPYSVPGLLELGKTCYEKGPKRSRSCQRMADLARGNGRIGPEC